MSGEREEKLRVQIAAVFVGRQQHSAVLTDYVSERGVFVRTDSPPRAMSLVRMRFALPPSGAVLEMHGMVARVVESFQAKSVSGLEIAFFAKSGPQGEEWTRFLGWLRERYPESLSRPVMLAAAGALEAPPSSRSQAAKAAKPAGPLPSVLLEQLARGRGFFLQTDQSFTLGSDLRVTLTSPASGASFALDCVVRRYVFGAGGGPGGMGVEVTNMTHPTRAELVSFLRASKSDEPLRVAAKEVYAPRAPAMMNTLPGPCSTGLARIEPAADPADSWASVDDGWC